MTTKVSLKKSPKISLQKSGYLAVPLDSQTETCPLHRFCQLGPSNFQKT